jgi:succinoglycan biosynthesis transport protein ExoP
MPDNQHPILSLPEAREFDRSEALALPNGHDSYPAYKDIEAAEENHFKEYLRSVRKHLWLVIGLTLIVTALAAMYEMRQTDIYKAQARVQVDLENNPASGAGKNSTIVINSPTSDPTYFNTQLQNLTSQALLRRVVKTLDLEHNRAFLNRERRSTWQNLLSIVGLDKKAADEKQVVPDNPLRLTSKEAPTTARDDLAEEKQLEPFVGKIQANLKVEPVREIRTGSQTLTTRLIDVSFNFSDPRLAAKIVNTIGDTFVNSNLEKKTETNASAGVFLQKRVADLQTQIRSAEERLINYAKDHQILSLDGNQNTVVERLGGLNTQLLQAENERKQAEAEYRAAMAPGAATALAGKDSKQFDEMEGKLATLRQKRMELLVENTEEWPEVKEVEQQIATLEKQINEGRGRATSMMTTNLETRYRQALDREKAIQTAFDKQRGETLTQNEAAVNYRIIQQEIATNKQLLDGLLQRSKENEIVLADTPNNIFVVDYALIPDNPIGPQRLRTVLMSFFLGLAGAVGLAIFLEYMNDSVRSTEDVDRWLRLPSLGVIPAIGGVSKRRLFFPVRSLQLNGNGNGNGHVSPELLLDVEKHSHLAEAYRHLRTSVLLSSAGHPPRILLVTSSLPGEGKTTTAVNTALSMAQTGGKVLIVDADMRRPRLHSIFNLKNHRGLSTILSNEMSEADVLGLITQQETNGLWVLTSGPLPPNPAELLGSESMRRLLKTLAARFTQIIIDSPPIGSFTDGVLISTQVDGVLLVVHSGKTSRNVARRARQILHDVGAKIFGVVLNNVNLREHDYYYYRGYYSNRYYEADPDVERMAS